MALVRSVSDLCHDFLFQSTRPRRGAISIFVVSYFAAYRQCFNPRAPGGARYYLGKLLMTCIRVSFNPRAPGGARYGAAVSRYFLPIVRVSIHAPPEGRDEFVHVQCPNVNPRCFNPRAPGGARSRRGWNRVIPADAEWFQSTRPRRGAISMRAWMLLPRIRFQSTRPRRGAIRQRWNARHERPVSIHAPPEGRDLDCLPCFACHTGFQSTRPRRGAIAIF